MTIAMPDSVIPANLPPGYPAYLAYVDGARSKDADAVRARFPSAEILTLTVLGGSAVADGCDREPGDLSPVSAAAWLHWRISSGAWRPVLYDSRDDVPATLGALAAAGVQRARIRILSAHYGAGRHICSPAACGASFTADGTQWTDNFTGAGGAVIDMSLLDDGFFGAAAQPGPIASNWTEFDMSKLRILKQGDADVPGQFWAVRRLQALLAAAGGANGIPSTAVAVDGQFGPRTTAAVEAVQAHYKITIDGIAGARTWSVLLTGAP